MARDIDKIVDEAESGPPREEEVAVNPYKVGSALWKLWNRREADRKKKQAEGQNTDSNN